MIYSCEVTVGYSGPPPVVMYEILCCDCGVDEYVLSALVAEFIHDGLIFVILLAFLFVGVSVGYPCMASFLGVCTSYIYRSIAVQFPADCTIGIMGKVGDEMISESFESIHCSGAFCTAAVGIGDVVHADLLSDFA